MWGSALGDQWNVKLVNKLNANPHMENPTQDMHPRHARTDANPKTSFSTELPKTAEKLSTDSRGKGKGFPLQA